ncbi:unnamed protein product [Pedinophyceae sp. YPF-701]|nr:unnamed protein product [Pedinophyceae sp. YPF-701]
MHRFLSEVMAQNLGRLAVFREHPDEGRDAGEPAPPVPAAMSGPSAPHQPTLIARRRLSAQMSPAQSRRTSGAPSDILAGQGPHDAYMNPSQNHSRSTTDLGAASDHIETGQAQSPVAMALQSVLFDPAPRVNAQGASVPTSEAGGVPFTPRSGSASPLSAVDLSDVPNSPSDYNVHQHLSDLRRTAMMRQLMRRSMGPVHSGGVSGPPSSPSSMTINILPGIREAGPAAAERSLDRTALAANAPFSMGAGSGPARSRLARNVSGRELAQEMRRLGVSGLRHSQSMRSNPCRSSMSVSIVGDDDDDDASSLSSADELDAERRSSYLHGTRASSPTSISISMSMGGPGRMSGALHDPWGGTSGVRRGSMEVTNPRDGDGVGVLERRGSTVRRGSRAGVEASWRNTVQASLEAPQLVTAGSTGSLENAKELIFADGGAATRPSHAAAQAAAQRSMLEVGDSSRQAGPVSPTTDAKLLVGNNSPLSPTMGLVNAGVAVSPSARALQMPYHNIGVEVPPSSVGRLGGPCEQIRRVGSSPGTDVGGGESVLDSSPVQCDMRGITNPHGLPPDR